MKTDKELADAVRDAVSTLNRTMSQAATAGLEVRLNGQDVTTFGERGNVQIDAHITRPL